MGWKEKAEFRASSLLRNTTHEDDMDQEMRSHFNQLVEDFKEQGMSDIDARRNARKEFGSIDRAKEECRDSWGTRLVFDFWRDVKFGFRQLRKSKAFTAVSVLTLAIAIGACATIYSALDAALFRNLPYPNPQQIVSIAEYVPGSGENSISGGAFFDWRDNSEYLQAVTLYNTVVQNMVSSDGAMRLNGNEVTTGFIETLGVQLVRGRGFRPEEGEFGGDSNVVILTEESWRARFGGDEDLIGQTIVLNEVPRKVIGILPAGAWLERDEEFFIPAILNPNHYHRYSRGNHWAQALGRMREGITPEHLQVELNTIKENINLEYPHWKRDWTVSVQSLQSKLAKNPKPILMILTAAVCAVLLIACANIANLLLARSAQRQREIALRSALGASAQRIARQVLTESLLLSTFGGLAGALLAYSGIELLNYLSSDFMPANMAPQLDGRVLAATIALTCGTGLLFGVLPAWKARKPNLEHALRSGGRSASGRTKLQSILVIAEVSLTVVLLASAGLFFRSLSNVMSEDLGYNPQHTLTFELTLPQEIYNGPEKCNLYLDTVLEQLESLPSVMKIGSSSSGPLADYASGNYGSRKDQPNTREHSVIGVVFVGGDFFEVLEARLLSGRFINQLDSRKNAAPACVIDQTLAKEFYPNENPIGHFFETTDGTREIVGVVEDLQIDTFDRKNGYAYLPHSEFPYRISITLRTRQNIASLIETVKGKLAEIDRGVPMANPKTVQDAFDEAHFQKRLVLNLIGGFAIVATLLACIGLYGVMSYSVNTRQREISIRRALGATTNSVISLVVRDGSVLTVVGVLIGLVGAVVAGHLLEGELYEVSGYDIPILASTLVIVATVSLISCWLPARLATRFDPNAALRSD